MLRNGRKLTAITFDGATWREQDIWELPDGEYKIGDSELSFDGEWIAVLVTPRENLRCGDVLYMVDPVTGSSQMVGLTGRMAFVQWTGARSVVVQCVRLVEGISDARGYTFRTAGLGKQGKWHWSSSWIVGRYLATIGLEKYFTQYGRDAERMTQNEDFGPLWSVDEEGNARRADGIGELPVEGQFWGGMRVNDGYTFLSYDAPDGSWCSALWCTYSGLLVKDSLAFQAEYPMDTTWGPAFFAAKTSSEKASEWRLLLWDAPSGDAGELPKGLTVPEGHRVIGFSYAEYGWWLVHDGWLLLWRPTNEDDPVKMYTSALLVEKYGEKARSSHVGVEELGLPPAASEIAFAAAYRDKPSAMTLFLQQPTGGLGSGSTPSEAGE